MDVETLGGHVTLGETPVLNNLIHLKLLAFPFVTFPFDYELSSNISGN